MNISGVLVRARPDRHAEVLAALRGISGTTIHQSEATTGSIVVTLEDGEGYSVEDSLLQLHLVDGIADASLVYQYSDDSLSKEALA
ncbi:MAG: chaperone NapD [Gammaproteobacteria bacterium]|nr:chaperone NapD [Gammaproteobacteria bacterium]MBU1415646.1 chaperone NapD [Gammaproteobacteria bacterium]